jgi:hypothetical protein
MDLNVSQLAEQLSERIQKALCKGAGILTHHASNGVRVVGRRVDEAPFFSNCMTSDEKILQRVC